MPIRPPQHRDPGARPAAQSRRDSQRAHDAHRRRTSPWRLWYGLRVWAAAREARLTARPLCERCEAAGRIVPATVVNHRRPHRGDWSLFVDPANHESVCKPCHDGVIQREERAAAR